MVSALEQSKALARHNFLQEAQHRPVPPLQTNLTERTRSVQAQGTRSNGTCRAQDADSARIVENGMSPCSQDINSPQSGRPHDQGHDSGEMIQVRTSFELVWSHLRPTDLSLAATATTATTIAFTMSSMLAT